MKSFLICVFAFLSATTVAARDKSVVCEYGDKSFWGVIASEFDGVWKMEHLSGVVMAGPSTIPFPSSREVETITMTNDNSLGEGSIVMTHPEAEEPFSLEWVDEPEWVFDGRQVGVKLDPVPQPVLTSDDLEMLTGCKNDQMARLVGKTFANVNGERMDFTYRLLIVGPDTLYGIMHASGKMQGTSFNAWRSVSLNR